MGHLTILRIEFDKDSIMAKTVGNEAGSTDTGEGVENSTGDRLGVVGAGGTPADSC